MKLNLSMKWKIFHFSRSPCKQLLFGGSLFSVLLSFSHASHQRGELQAEAPWVPRASL